MYDGPYWVILLTYESNDMRHTGFRRLTVVNGTPGNGASQICPWFFIPHKQFFLIRIISINDNIIFLFFNHFLKISENVKQFKKINKRT